MPKKTSQQLQNELDIQATLKQERQTSDKTYAIKLVERIVFGFLALLAASVIGGVVDIVISHFK